jgi:prolipoprotein diacylglyceryltransferase
LFLYEALWNLLAFFVLLSIYNWSRRTIEPASGFQRALFRFAHRLNTGDIFLLYVLQYMFIRFLLEFIRVEVAYLPGTTINSSQAFCVVVFVITLAVFMVRRNAPKRENAETSAAA